MKSGLLGLLVYAVLVIVLLTGEVKCIIKVINCNWEPIGKAEAVYTIGAVTGFGCIIGYLDIEDK
jgi:hypothetical protein